MTKTSLPEVKWASIDELVKGVDYKIIDGQFIDLRPNELLCGLVYIDKELANHADETKAIRQRLEAIIKPIDTLA
jgi:hypothetical protein